MCTKHQNFALKLRALISVGVKINLYLDIVAKLFPGSLERFLESIPTESVTYFLWKQVDVLVKKVGKEVPVKKMGIINNVTKTSLQKIYKNSKRSSDMFNT